MCHGCPICRDEGVGSYVKGKGMERIRTVIYGCGVMGQKIAEALFDKSSFEIVGAIDIDKELVGKDLGDVFDRPCHMGVLIENDPDSVLKKSNAHTVVLATTSHLRDATSQITQCVKAGLNVVSTCEELSYPWKRNQILAQDIDRLAKANDVSVVGTGINPGYLMDTLPLFLTAPCLQVDSVKVVRMMNSAKRRVPFQRKVGTGLTLDEFDEQIKAGIISGHVGLLESMYTIANGLGWILDDAVEQIPKPVIDEKEIKTAVGTVRPGDVIGLISKADGIIDGRVVIALEFNANAAVKKEYDETIIRGIPDIHQKIHGGVHGDIGTVAVTINTIPTVIRAAPGLVLMKDLPLVTVTQ